MKIYNYLLKGFLLIIFTCGMSLNSYNSVYAQEEQEAPDDDNYTCQYNNKKNPTFKRGCKPAPGWVCMPC